MVDRIMMSSRGRAEGDQNAQQEQPSAPQKPRSRPAGVLAAQARACSWPCTPQALSQQRAAAKGRGFFVAVRS